MASRNRKGYRKEKRSRSRPLVDWVRKCTRDTIADFECLSSDMAALTPIFLESGLFDEATGLPVPGFFIGYCGLRGKGPVFEYDEYELYRTTPKILHNSNVLVFGEIDMRKSSLVKSYIDQRARVGRNSLIIDPKGEYRDLAYSIPGSQILDFSVDSDRFVNVHDPRLPEDLRIRLTVAMAKHGLVGNHSIDIDEHSMIREAMVSAARAAEKEGRIPVLPDTVALLFEPNDELVTAVRMAPEESEESPDSWLQARKRFKAKANNIAKALWRWTEGDLKGPFHKETSPGLFDPCRCLVLDINALPEEVKPMLVTLFIAFAENQLGSGDEADRFDGIFLDESWDLARIEEYIDALVRLFKLGRTKGIAVWVISHHLSNLERASDYKAVQNLVSDAGTIVNFSQNWEEISVSARKMGLTPEIAERIAELDAGQAIWRIGKKFLFPVNHRTSPRMRRISETSHLLLGQSRETGENEENAA